MQGKKAASFIAGDLASREDAAISMLYGLPVDEKGPPMQGLNEKHGISLATLVLIVLDHKMIIDGSFGSLMGHKMHNAHRLHQF